MSLVWPGAFLQNRYLVLQAIGKGGTSQTFDVDDAGTVKVLKVLDLQRINQMEGKQKAIALFQREAEVLIRLNCPGIPQVQANGYFVLDQPDQEPNYCLVMEKIDGLNLEKWLEQRHQLPIPAEQAIAWLRQLMTILEPLHQAGLIHRDIKPSNIMLKPDGQLVLIDFGGVREVSETYLRNITGTGLISPGYTPLEQAEGKAVLQSDYFALARTMVHLLTGKHPIDLERDPRNGKLLWQDSAPQVAQPLVELLDYMMALLPGRRPQTPQLILKYLDEMTQTAIAADSTPPSSLPAHAKPAANPVPKPALLQKLTGVFRGASLPQNSWRRSALRGTLRDHTGTVSAIAISTAHHILVSGSHDTTVKLWSVRAKTLLQTLTQHRDRVTGIALSPDDLLFASSSFDQTICLWSLPDGKLQQTLTGHQHRITGVTFSPNGRMLMSSSSREIYLWSVQTGRLLRTLSDEDTDAVRAIAFSADGRSCILGYRDGTFQIWNPHTGQLVHSFTTPTGSINAIAPSANGHLLASSVGRVTQLWHATTYAPLRTLDDAQDGSSAIAFDPTSQVLASGGDRAIALWQPQTGELLRRLEGHTSAIRSLAFSGNGNLLASGSQDTTIKLWVPIP
ncbi:MAG: serine/threonine-protein kinase [Leptolyngbyaceae cyanobacterium bins.349]|nr:serine/threonine-protein kinase [Leptolyngbyaceae cyanobacterium bins.349]